MATISENLQILKNSTDAIKQAIIDKGGTINGDITTWANAISEISGGGGSDNLKILSFGSESRVYIDGMTWGEWVDSIYNTNSSHYGVFRKSGTDGPIYCNYGEVYKDGGAVQIFASQLISDSIIYGIMHNSGGGA
jgi:hypothetical protein